MTRRYRRYLRLVSSSRVRSTTSGGEDQFCWGATAVHGCAGWALPNGEPRFQEATLWITPPLGCTHLQEERDTHTHIVRDTAQLSHHMPISGFYRYLVSTPLSRLLISGSWARAPHWVPADVTTGVFSQPFEDTSSHTKCVEQLWDKFTKS